MTEQANDMIAINALMHLGQECRNEVVMRRRMVIFIEMYLIDNNVLSDSLVRAFATAFEQYYYSRCSSYEVYNNIDCMEQVLASFIKLYNIQKI